MATVTAGEAIDNDKYHTGIGVSHSALQVFRRDPREYQWKYILGNHDRQRKDYFDFGSAVHEVALLGNKSNIKLIPECVLSSNGAKSGKAWKEYEQENVGFLLLKQPEFDAVMDCVKTIYEHPLASKLLACEGPAEHCYRHEDGLLRLHLKCKPDKLAVTPHGTVVVDLKTTESVNPAAFAKSIVSYHYDCQRYFYERVLRALNIDVVDFVFIAVSKQPPHCVNCFSINGEDMATACTLVEDALTDLSERYESDNWLPRDHDKVIRLSLPSYARYRGDYE